MKEKEKDDRIARLLHEHLPFSLIPLERLRQYARDIQVRQVPAGHDILLAHGEPAEYLYIVGQGSVDLLNQEDQSNVLLIDTLEVGEFFGHPSLIRGKPPQVTVRSREETTLYLLPADSFFRLRYEQRAFGQFLDNAAFDRLMATLHKSDSSEAPEFRVRLRDILQRKLICVTPDINVRDAARLMKQNDVRYVIVDTSPPGILTDHDLRNRVMIEGLSYDTPAGQVMTSPLLTLPADSLVFEGLMTLLEHRIRHLPVTENGQIIGVVTHIDILRQQTHSPLFLPRQLARARSLDELRRYTDQVTRAVGGFLDAGARVSDIGRMVAVSHSALLEHLLRNAEAELGPPPCPYAWMVLGSEGRYEQTLRTDQDNALVYADDAPPEAEAYFKQLAEHIVELLVACGFPRCPGDIMATNPRWRQPLHVWKRYVHDWIHVPDEEALMRASIFFDYRRVYGALDIERELRPIIQEAGKNRIFLGRLARNALRQSPPLGWFFRDFAVEHDEHGQSVIDMKMRGTALVVDLARLFAIEAGSTATNTVTRLHLAAPRSDLSEAGSRELIAAFEYISLLRLRHQYAQLKRGEQPTNYLQVDRLSTLERRELKESFRAIEKIQRSATSLYGTSMMA